MQKARPARTQLLLLLTLLLSSTTYAETTSEPSKGGWALSMASSVHYAYRYDIAAIHTFRSLFGFAPQIGAYFTPYVRNYTVGESVGDDVTSYEYDTQGFGGMRVGLRWAESRRIGYGLHANVYYQKQTWDEIHHDSYFVDDPENPPFRDLVYVEQLVDQGRVDGWVIDGGITVYYQPPIPLSLWFQVGYSIDLYAQPYPERDNSPYMIRFGLDIELGENRPPSKPVVDEIPARPTFWDTYRPMSLFTEVSSYSQQDFSFAEAMIGYEMPSPENRRNIWGITVFRSFAQAPWFKPQDDIRYDYADGIGAFGTVMFNLRNSLHLSFDGAGFQRNIHLQRWTQNQYSDEWYWEGELESEWHVFVGGGIWYSGTEKLYVGMQGTVEPLQLLARSPQKVQYYPGLRIAARIIL